MSLRDVDGAFGVRGFAHVHRGGDKRGEMAKWLKEEGAGGVMALAVAIVLAVVLVLVFR